MKRPSECVHLPRNYQPHLPAASFAVAQRRLCTAAAAFNLLIASFKVIIVAETLDDRRRTADL